MLCLCVVCVDGSRHGLCAGTARCRSWRRDHVLLWKWFLRRRQQLLWMWNLRTVDSIQLHSQTLNFAFVFVHRAGSGVVRIDVLCFLAGCCTRRLNQALSIFCLNIHWLKNAPNLTDYDYDPGQSIFIIFSKVFVNDHKSCLVVKFSTSPHVCCHYTLWNTMLYFALITLLIAKNAPTSDHHNFNKR